MKTIETRKKLHTNDYILINSNGCHISITNGIKAITIKSNCFLLIEKRRLLTTAPYDCIELNQGDINNVIKIMSPFFYDGKLKSLGHTKKNKTENYIFSIEKDKLSNELYKAIKSTNNYRLKLYKLACFLSKGQDPQRIFDALITSTTNLFSDRIRRIIDLDTSKKWKLSTIAKEICLSEISIRKKLSAENTSFCQILLEVRMKKAAMLILRNELQMSKISCMVGISSVSHFIKVFNLYYGLTPKKFLTRQKEKRIRLESSDI
ncbi:helix-turn-helix transcriptional regulator [Escherichia coli]|nr:helix-turn-helix transcriptional regulator [Escherichia coli]EHV5333300.1 helix-turn-helix transcriptional regulator [Escherichia coli]